MKDQRIGVRCDTEKPKDFSPTVLVPLKENEVRSNVVEVVGEPCNLQNDAQDEISEYVSWNKSPRSL